MNYERYLGLWDDYEAKVYDHFSSRNTRRSRNEEFITRRQYAAQPKIFKSALEQAEQQRGHLATESSP